MRTDGRTKVRTDRQTETDITKLTVAFHKIAKVPKNWLNHMKRIDTFR